MHLTNGQFLFAFVLAGLAGTLVFFHAERNRVRHPSAWASFVFLFLIVGLPTYLVHVRRLRRARGRQVVVTLILVVFATTLVVVVVLGLHVWGAIQDGREERARRASDGNGV